MLIIVGELFAQCGIKIRANFMTTVKNGREQNGTVF